MSCAIAGCWAPCAVQVPQNRSRLLRAPAVPSPCSLPQLHRQPGRQVRAQGAGEQAVAGWLDLASFVASSGSGGHTPFDELADKIGRDVYIDVQGWHLYLKDVKAAPGAKLTLAQALAAQLGPKIQSSGFKPAELEPLLKKVPVKLGAGRLTAALSDLLPAGCLRDFERACEDYARNC